MKFPQSPDTVNLMTAPKFDNWLEHGSGVEAKSARHLFSIISNIALLAPNRIYAWRGQNNANWPLRSSLYRKAAKESKEVTEKSLRAEERKIIKEARDWGLGRDLGSSATDLHMLAVLQHHSVPTRLIDVTANPMTALWFATAEHGQCEDRPDSGVLFAIEVTDTRWHETFKHGSQTRKSRRNPITALYEKALLRSAKDNTMFRAFPALPDDRMRAQEGYFIGSAVPEKHTTPGVFGFNPIGPESGRENLANLLEFDKPAEAPFALPFCAIVIPYHVKLTLRDPLKRTYNRRRRVLFPDVDGFKEAWSSGRLD
ncbi:FRG domain-containing protein [Actinosynnema pretiosum]|nr:FRG domain-containing protein [Actinosynnema pretiosum]